MIKKILALSCLLVSVSYPQLHGPSITLQEKAYNFGTVVQGVKVKHSFFITNNGDDTLKISKIRASCGCTAALADKKEILPGESTKINIVFNSLGRSGHQLKRIFIRSNDIDKPEVFFELYGEVVKENTVTKKDTTSIMEKEKQN